MGRECLRLRGGSAVLALLVLAVPAPASAALLTQGFEDGAPAWTTTGMWHVQSGPDAIRVSPAIAGRLVTLPDGGYLPAAPQGSALAWFGQASTGTYCGDDFASVPQTPRDGCTSAGREAGTLTSPVFSLADQPLAFVAYDAWWEIEAKDADRSDLMRVELSTDGGSTWSVAESLNPLVPAWGGGHHSYSDAGVRLPGAWTRHVAALPGAGGADEVQLRFVFDTVDTARNGFRGLLVDNVALVDEAGAVIEGAGDFGNAPELPPGESDLGALPAEPGEPPAEPAQGPARGRTFDLAYVSGRVRYHRPGARYARLPDDHVVLPLDSVVDTTRGRARVAVEADDAGTIESAEFYTGAFGVFQRRTAADPSASIADIVLAAGNFGACRRAAGALATPSRRPRPIRRLWGAASGQFRTRGRYASATIRGTRWLTQDFCSATRVTVRKGVVDVFDYRRKRARRIRAGQSITVTASRSPRYRRRSGSHPPRLSSGTRQ
jgi:hypothetical protein